MTATKREDQTVWRCKTHGRFSEQERKYCSKQYHNEPCVGCIMIPYIPQSRAKVLVEALKLLKKTIIQNGYGDRKIFEIVEEALQSWEGEK